MHGRAVPLDSFSFCVLPHDKLQRSVFNQQQLPLSLVEGSACNDVCHKVSGLLDRDKTNKVHTQTSTYLLPESGLRASMRAVRGLTCKAPGATDVHTVQGLTNPPGGASHISICEDLQVVSVDSQRIRILESCPQQEPRCRQHSPRTPSVSMYLGEESRFCPPI